MLSRNLTYGSYQYHFCNKIKEYKDDSQIIKEEIKKTFPEVFSEGLVRCTKMTAKIRLKKNAQPVFRKKRSIVFTAIDKIEKERGRLTQCGVLLRVDYSDWAAPVVYEKKKIRKNTRQCRFFHKVKQRNRRSPLSAT